MTTTSFWKARDGRRIAVSKMEDDHLACALRMGLRALQRTAHDAALENLACAYSGDGGCEYLGDVQYETELAKSRDLPALRRRLEATPRYAPLVAEAKRRGLRWNRRKAVRTAS